MNIFYCTGTVLTGDLFMGSIKAIGFVFFFGAILFSPNLAAAEIDIKEQRRLFSRGERIANKPKSWEYRQIVRQLSEVDYPLLPYIEQKTLMRFPYLSNKTQIDKFLTNYANTPLDRPLRKKWLNYLARNDEPELFLTYYKDINDPVLACHKVRMELEKPALKAQALNGIDNLWLIGKSQPKECDPAFKVWQNAGRRTQEMIWRRMALAANGGNHTLIPYLKKLLVKDQQYLGDLWLKVRRSPSFASRLSEFPGTFPEKEAEILAYGFGRLIWRDRNLALKSWDKANKRFQFSQEQVAYITGRFALALASADHDKAGEWLDKTSQFGTDEELFRWQLTHLLRKQDWQKVLAVVESAPVEVSSDLTYQYWQGRSYENIGAKPQADTIFGQLADNRHYYGFLASGKIKRDIHLMDHPLTYTPEEIAAVETRPAARRAKEFLALKRLASARREWVHFQAKIDDQQKLISAVIADDWGWHDRAIFTLSRVGYLDDVKLRFPLAYDDEVIRQSKSQDIDPAWAFAIARRESSFMADANSGAGARGLMQLLPSTVNFITKKNIKSRKLFEPSFNIQQGTQYMRYLMDRVGNNSVLATASYNAGWSRVKNWVPKDNAIPLDIWVETIPFKETRNYVKAVLAYQQIYSRLLGEDDNLFHTLADMEISRKTLSL